MTTVQNLIDELVTNGRTLMEERDREFEARAAERREARDREMNEKWATVLSEIRAALPEWVEPFIARHDCEPTRLGRYGRENAPARVEIPGLAPMYAWVEEGGLVTLQVLVPSVEVGEESDDPMVSWHSPGPFWANSDDHDDHRGHPAADFAIAVAEARENADEAAEKLAAPRPVPQTEPAPSPALSPREASLAELRQIFAHNPADIAIAAALVHLCEHGLGPAEGGAA